MVLSYVLVVAMVPMLVTGVQICLSDGSSGCDNELGDRSVNAKQFPGLSVADTERDGWVLIFRATSGNGDSAYAAYMSGTETVTTKPTSMTRSYAKHYRNPVIDSWASYNIEYVKVALYKNENEVAYIIFNAIGTSKTDWFTESMLIESSWSDMTPSDTFDFFSVAGDTVTRRFFINSIGGACGAQKGHLVVLDATGTCAWDNQARYPSFLYSESNHKDVWDRHNYGHADYFAIFALTS